MHYLTTRLASPTQRWALMPALVSPRLITLLLSVPTLRARTWITAALSARSSAPPLPMVLKFLLIRTADLAQSLLHGTSSRQLSQWTTPVKLYSCSNRSGSATRSKLTRQGHHSSDL